MLFGNHSFTNTKIEWSAYVLFVSINMCASMFIFIDPLHNPHTLESSFDWMHFCFDKHPIPTTTGSLEVYLYWCPSHCLANYLYYVNDAIVKFNNVDTLPVFTQEKQHSLGFLIRTSPGGHVGNEQRTTAQFGFFLPTSKQVYKNLRVKLSLWITCQKQNIKCAK